MKTKSPEEYANEVIEKYHNLLFTNTDGYFGEFRHPNAIQCAIIDVTHTLESFMDFEIYTTDQFTKTNGTDLLNYYTEVLTILKTK